VGVCVRACVVIVAFLLLLLVSSHTHFRTARTRTELVASRSHSLTRWWAERYEYY